MIHDSYLMKAFNKDNRKKLIAFSVRHITHTQNHLLTKIQLQLHMWFTVATISPSSMPPGGMEQKYEE